MQFNSAMKANRDWGLKCFVPSLVLKSYHAPFSRHISHVAAAGYVSTAVMDCAAVLFVFMIKFTCRMSNKFQCL